MDPAGDTVPLLMVAYTTECLGREVCAKIMCISAPEIAVIKLAVATIRMIRLLPTTGLGTCLSYGYPTKVSSQLQSYVHKVLLTFLAAST